MLKVFTIKFENNLESFNDSALSNFISDKEITRWESQFFEQKNEHYWTIIIEYSSMVPSLEKNRHKGEFKKDETYKKLLSENDWPLYNRLREWRAERSKEAGVPPYIIFTNIQLAKIAVTRPVSLNSFQQVEGVGNAKREKYGSEIIQMVKSFGLPVKSENIGEQNG
jgi:superfamily II DNA helicase RecQ